MAVLALLAVSACTAPTSQVATSCTQDSDCATGQACDTASRSCVASGGGSGNTGATGGTGGTGGTTGGSAAQPGPPNAEHSQLLLTPGRVAADGASACEVRVVVRDGNNVLIPGQAVSVSASGSQNALRPASGSTNSDGTFLASLTSTQIETKTVTATLAGSFNLTAAVDFTSGPPSLADSSWAADSSATPVADGTAAATFTLTLHDASSRPAAGQAVTFTASGGRNTLTASAPQTDASGVITVRLTSQAAEPKVVTAHIGSARLDASATFVPGDPNLLTSSFTADPNISPADGTASVGLSLVVADAFGNPISGLQVTLDGNGTLDPDHGTTNASGIFSAQLTSTHAETDTITAHFGGLSLNANVELVASPSALHSSLTASPNSLEADNASLATLTFTLRDGEGAPMADQPVAFASASGNANDTLGTRLAQTDPSGVATTTLRSSAPGSRLFTASVGGTFSLSTPVFFRATACSTPPLLPGLPALALSGSPNTVVAGNFDGDALPDLLVVSSSGNTQVWRGLGDGKFSLAANKAGNAGAGSAWVGDIVGSASTDAVVANSASNTISVFAGDGSGGLATPVTYAAGSNPASLGVADFNADGKLDVAVANPGDNVVRVLLNAGTGTFGAPTAFTTQHAPVSLAVGNFDADPNIDIVVANNANDTITLLSGNGNGTFRPGTFVGCGGSQPSAVALADFNGDGLNDLLVANANSDTVTFHQSNGDGTFLRPVPTAVGHGPQALWVGRLNGDTYLDAVVVDTAGSDLRILYGVGNGAFTVVRANAGDTPLSATAADFNQDGRVDLAVAGYGGNAINVQVQTPAGAFPGPAARYPAHDSPAAVATTDLNGDGLLDLVTANAGADLTVTLGTAGGGMGPTLAYAAHTSPVAVATGDFDEDGVPDVVAANTASNDVSLLRGVGNGALITHADYAVGDAPAALVVGLFNADTHLDVAVANYGSDTVTVLLGTGQGTFQSPATYSVGHQPAGLVAGTFDAGTSVDLVVSNRGSNNISFLANDGTGAFEAGIASPAGTTPTQLIAGDFNGDGKTDVLAVNGTPGVVLLVGDGHGTFDAPALTATTAAPQAFAVADFDSDGKPDLAVTDTGVARIALFKGDGTGAFTALGAYSTGRSPVGLTVADFNGDGRMDLASANQSSNDVGVLLSGGCGP